MFFEYLNTQLNVLLSIEIFVPERDRQTDRQTETETEIDYIITDCIHSTHCNKQENKQYGQDLREPGRAE